MSLSVLNVYLIISTAHS